MHCWGPGLAMGTVLGVMKLHKWDTLLEKETTFHITGAGKDWGGAVVSFVVDGKAEATCLAGGSVLGGLVGVNGVCVWRKAEKS